MGYLKATDPGATLGLENKYQEKLKDLDNPDIVCCPTCQGYGQWHSLLDEYGPGRHQDVACADCNGWGWLASGQEPYMTMFNRIKDTFGPHLAYVNNTVVLTNEDLYTHKDLKAALVYKADGWWPFNYGGEIRELSQSKPGRRVFKVKVFID